MTRERVAGVVVLGATALFALAPLFRGSAEFPTAQHHVLHAAMIAGSVVAAVLLAQPSRAVGASHLGWLLLAMFAPFAAMALMWPSEYAWFERHPGGHAIEHLALVLLGFLTAYAGQRYAAGVGWATGLTLIAMALASAWGFGVAPT